TCALPILIEHESNLIPISFQQSNSKLMTISGETLININHENYTQEKTRLEARIFFQYLIEQHIPNNQIVSSQILKQLFQSTYQ
ncbi:MAG: hypothetical protein N4Q32_04020, partial [Neisseriaceae bacterium]|nr:hypothetical protein [Neisseriaceae bacterium]